MPLPSQFATATTTHCGPDIAGEASGASFGDDWVAMEPEGTKLAWEFPTKPNPFVDEKGAIGNNIDTPEVKRFFDSPRAVPGEM
jgi:hypothetical protein